MQEELEALRKWSDEHVDFHNVETKPSVSISLVKDLVPTPISEPLDVHALARGVYADFSYYDEAGDVYRGPSSSGPNTYL